MDEVAVFGWRELSRFTGKSERALYRRRAELHEAGVVSYTFRQAPHGGKYKAMFFFPSVIKAYIMRVTMDGQMF